MFKLYFTGLAKRVGARVLIASTSEIYGDPNVHPQSETYWGHVNPIGKNKILYFEKNWIKKIYKICCF